MGNPITHSSVHFAYAKYFPKFSAHSILFTFGALITGSTKPKSHFANNLTLKKKMNTFS